MPYDSEIQTGTNLAWFLPRPKADHYKGGMPLHCEGWLIALANDILGREGKLLNVFCGMNKYGLRVDINPEVKPDLLVDVHRLTEYIDERFDIILADPPYSNEESRELYGTPKLNYKRWATECDRLLNPGGLFIVYHKYIMPNPSPANYNVVKRVFIGNRTYHLLRAAIYFQKKKQSAVPT